MSQLVINNILAKLTPLKQRQCELEMAVTMYQARRNHGVFEADLLRSNIERYNEAVTELDRDITDIVRAEIQSHSHDDDDRNSKELQTWLQKYYLPKRPQLLKL